MKKLSIICMVSMLFFSCKKAELDPQITTPGNVSTAPNPFTGRDAGLCVPTSTTVTMLAGQTINSGSVSVTNDGTNLFVTYTSINGWQIAEIQLYVGEYANAPQNNGGNPIPGRFPYKQSFSPYVTSYTQTIPLSGLPDCFVVAAHSVVKSGTTFQTGWGQGTQFPGNNWGMYFDYCKLQCP
jgi:hypothetical protein